MNLTYGNYITIFKETQNAIQEMLLPLECPEEMVRAYLAEQEFVWLEVLRNVTRCTGFDNYRSVHVPVLESELGPALRRDEYSFSLPPDREFPLLLRRVDNGQAYAPQYVDSVRLFSPKLADMVSIPVFYFSGKSLRTLERSVGFLHEMLHVLQRVLRRQRTPAYCHTGGDGQRKVRNPVVYVQRGIEDEIEVQKILGLAGYERNLHAILYHKENLTGAFRDEESLVAKSIVRKGIESIPFHKYEGLFDRDLKTVLLDHFCNGIGR